MASLPTPEKRVVAEKALVAFLVKTGAAERERLAEAEHLAAARAISLIEALSEKGILNEDDLAGAVARGLRLPLLNLETLELDSTLSLLVKEETAIRLSVIPVRKEEERLLVAMANPLDHEAVRRIEFASGCRVRLAVAPRKQILKAIEQIYRLDPLHPLLNGGSEAGLDVVYSDEPQQPSDTDLKQLAREAQGAPIVKMVNLIMVDALANNASDIHIEPGQNVVQVRYRVNGVLEDILQIPKWAQAAVTARIKVMAKLDITERRNPQDGHLRVRYEGDLVDFRVSSLPTSDGEKLVLRVLNQATGLRSIDHLGLSERDLKVLQEAMAAPEGMILCTGPTGSGKTTTLYSIIRELFSPELNIVTIENPVEYQVKGINQVSVNEKKGLTFAGALRSILRQDPDVILVGEIRDRETAEIAFQAAQTGHLVLSTLHTNDTVSTITRLTELGVEPNVLGATLKAIVAQRLVRTVCTACAERKTLETEVSQALGADTNTVVRGKGCPACRHSGYASRTGIYEILHVSKPIQKLIESKAPESGLREIARHEGTISIREDALSKIQAGLTTPEEVARVVHMDSGSAECPGCLNPIEENFTCCPFCLHVLRLLCPACGVTLKKEWKACPYCGPSARPAAAAATGNGAQGLAAGMPIQIVGGDETLQTIIRAALERGGLTAANGNGGAEGTPQLIALVPVVLSTPAAGAESEDASAAEEAEAPRPRRLRR